MPVHPRTARFAVCTVAHGSGLAASAFGMLHCTANVDALLARWLARRTPGDEACLEMEQRTLITYFVGALETAGSEDTQTAPPNARHFIVPNHDQCYYQDVKLASDVDVVDALVELRGVGARTLPVLRGRMPCEQEVRFHTALVELLETPSTVDVEWRRRREWLAPRGDAFACVAAAMLESQAFNFQASPYSEVQI